MGSQYVLNDSVKHQQDENNTSSTLVNMRASMHIKESLPASDSKAIYVEDSAKQASVESAKHAAVIKQ